MCCGLSSSTGEGLVVLVKPSGKTFKATTPRELASHAVFEAPETDAEPVRDETRVGPQQSVRSMRGGSEGNVRN